MSKGNKGRRGKKRAQSAPRSSGKPQGAQQASAKKEPASKTLLYLRRVTLRHVLGFLVLAGLISVASLSVKTFFLVERGSLSITYPWDGSLFPPEIIAPTIWWEDSVSDASKWHVSIEFEGSFDKIDVDVDTTFWIPDEELWESIKAQTLDTSARVTISSQVSFAGISRTLSSQTISISTSPDSVGAPIYFRDIPLPFISAVANISTIKWRLGNIGSYDPPPVTLSDLPVCGNCHSFSADGQTLGMDVDVANDKGAYVITPFEPETVFSRDKIFSWYTYYGEGPSDPTFGLLARISPDGRYVVGGMKDRAVFLARPDLAYSQLFFPVFGSLAYYDRNTRSVTMLPGADDERYVQANATWTADGEYVTFARSAVPTLTTTQRQPNVSLSIPEAAEVLGGEQYIDESSEGYNKFRYDLYTLPFNDGRGGEPVPVPGASDNGKSNYFPKYSPDGKWLVFTQAESFMLLMPDSRLYIMPAEGGEARLMNCNTESMNSWHSWSPNSKWLVFSSKLFSPYTQLFLTHIDDNGMDTPPILLKNFVIPERAANIPEFVNIEPDSKRVIEERFVDDYNYLRRGRRLEMFGRVAEAQQHYLESLNLNPHNTDSRLALGLSFANRGQLDEAEAAFMEIPEDDPGYNRALFCLGGVYAVRGDFTAAIDLFRRSLTVGESDDYFEANVHLNVGRAYFFQEDYDAAIGELQTALRIDPSNTDAVVHLGNIKVRRGDIEGALRDFERALELDPSLDSLREYITELERRLNG